jgi:orotidine-5'-phosphate decarboxylase
MPGMVAEPGSIGTFGQRLAEAARANDSLLCVGLDPEPSRFPASLRQREDITGSIVAFNAAVIAATADLVCAYKPNLAFYVAHGSAGIVALEETRRLIPPEIPVILDAKVGDMANTAAAYAKGYFETWDFDAVTVNPYLGEDSLAPFMRHADKGVFVICKTSNPGSGDLQDIPFGGAAEEQPLYLTVADRAARWAERWPATLGLVVGATYPDELAAVRRHAPNLPILMPGIGAQAGDLEAAVTAGMDAFGAGLLVSASRSVIYAGADGETDWSSVVRAAASELRDEINAVRTSRIEGRVR